MAIYAGIQTMLSKHLALKHQRRPNNLTDLPLLLVFKTDVSGRANARLPTSVANGNGRFPLRNKVTSRNPIKWRPDHVISPSSNRLLCGRRQKSTLLKRFHVVEPVRAYKTFSVADILIKA